MTLTILALLNLMTLTILALMNLMTLMMLISLMTLISLRCFSYPPLVVEQPGRCFLDTAFDFDGHLSTQDKVKESHFSYSYSQPLQLCLWRAWTTKFKEEIKNKSLDH
jgi:hypothetical protein